MRSIPADGHEIVATLALAGPEKCSGLPICRYDAHGLTTEFVAGLLLVNCATESHITPWGKAKAQEFTYAPFHRTRELNDRTARPIEQTER